MATILSRGDIYFPFLNIDILKYTTRAKVLSSLIVKCKIFHIFVNVDIFCQPRSSSNRSATNSLVLYDLQLPIVGIGYIWAIHCTAPLKQTCLFRHSLLDAYVYN